MLGFGRKYLSVVKDLLLLILTCGRSARSHSQNDHCHQSKVRAPSFFHVHPPSQNRKRAAVLERVVASHGSKTYWNCGSLCADDVWVKPFAWVSWLSREEHRFQPCFHLRPLRIDDAVINGMANATASRNHVISEDAFFARANPQNGHARALIQRVSFQFHADAAKRFERVLQQQILGLSVYGCSLPFACHPRPADFHAPVRAVDAPIACASNRAAAVFFHKR